MLRLRPKRVRSLFLTFFQINHFHKGLLKIQPSITFVNDVYLKLRNVTCFSCSINDNFRVSTWFLEFKISILFRKPHILPRVPVVTTISQNSSFKPKLPWAVCPNPNIVKRRNPITYRITPFNDYNSAYRNPVPFSQIN